MKPRTSQRGHRGRGVEPVILERRQVVVLTLGVVVAVGLSFSGGLLSGKRLGTLQSNADCIPTLVETDTTEGQSAEERALTYYERLTKPMVRTLDAPSTKITRQPAKPAAEPRKMVVKPAEKSGSYSVQVSAYRTRPEAEAHAASLRRKGHKPFVVRAELGNKGTWYRVRLGTWSNRKEAQAAKKRLLKDDIPGWIIATR